MFRLLQIMNRANCRRSVQRLCTYDKFYSTKLPAYLPIRPPARFFKGFHKKIYLTRTRFMFIRVSFPDVCRRGHRSVKVPLLNRWTKSTVYDIRYTRIFFNQVSPTIRVRSFGIFRNKNIFQIRIRIYSGYSAPRGKEIQVFRNENSFQTNAYSQIPIIFIPD